MVDELKLDTSFIKRLWPIGSLVFGFACFVWAAATDVEQVQSIQVAQASQINHLETLESNQEQSYFSLSNQIAALSQQVADIKANQANPQDSHQ